jgi:2-phospho-L-lactate guanylyltransferase
MHAHVTAPATRLPAPFGAVVPLKPAAVGKSRLAPLGQDVRRELVHALAADTVAAVLACPLVEAVVVVTDDAVAARELRALGAVVVPDRRPGRLNRTLELGVADLMRLHPLLRPVAVCADLPGLSSAELADALRLAPLEASAFVADADGVGTTAYLAPTPALFHPRFGEASRAAHLAAGAVELAAGPSLRRDVDTPEDLAATCASMTGPRTSSVVRRHGLFGQRVP